MGAIITTPSSLSSSSSNQFSSYSSYLPSYYCSNLTLQDINNCSKLWMIIIDNSIPSPLYGKNNSFTSLTSLNNSLLIQQNTSINNSLQPIEEKGLDNINSQVLPHSLNTPQAEYCLDTCKSWFYSTLYKHLLTDYQNSKIRQFGMHSFLRTMLEMIPASLHQYKDPLRFKKHIQNLTLRCHQSGVTIDYITNFGNHLFSTISVLDSSLEMIVSWKRLYSSILLILIPSFLQNTSRLASPTVVSGCAFEFDDNDNETVKYYSTLPKFQPVSMERFYTSMENSIA